MSPPNSSHLSHQSHQPITPMVQWDFCCDRRRHSSYTSIAPEADPPVTLGPELLFWRADSAAPPHESSRLPAPLSPEPPGMMRTAVMLLAMLTGPLALAEESPDDFFERKIRPVLVDKCYNCHSAEGDSIKANLFLDSRDGMRRGGDSGPAVVPGDLKKSLIIDAIKYESVEMPPKGKLPDNVIADFVKWVEMGAPDPRTESTKAAQAVAASTIDWTKAREFWAFQKPERHPQPKVSTAEWVERPIDGFVLAKLDEAGL